MGESDDSLGGGERGVRSVADRRGLVGQQRELDVAVRLRLLRSGHMSFILSFHIPERAHCELTSRLGGSIRGQYHRIYSPVTFGKKHDPQGKYVKHFLPVLKGTYRKSGDPSLESVSAILPLSLSPHSVWDSFPCHHPPHSLFQLPHLARHACAIHL